MQQPVRLLLSAALLSTSYAATAQAGTLDPTFGTNGYVTFTLGNENVYAAAALVLPNGQLMAVSGVYAPSADIALQRYNADGTLDPSFGTDGVVTIDVNTGSEDRPTDAYVQADGKIVVVGSTDGAILVMRLNADGSLDTSFGTDGWSVFDVIADELDYVGDCVVRPTGEVVVICTNEGENEDGRGSVVQFTPSGALDAAFGTNGVLTINNGIPGATEQLHAIEIASSGTIHVLGTARTAINSTDDTYVYRITPAGTLDPDFDGDGHRLVPIGTGDELPSAIAVLANGQVLLAGSTNMAGIDHPFVARLNADGSFDTAFGDDGVHIMTGIIGQYVGDLLLRPSGQVVFSGEAFNGVGTDMLIARLHADGSFDTTFGTGGYTRTLIGSQAGFEGGYALALAPDGNYIMTGGTGTAFAGTRTQVILKYRSGATTSIVEHADARVRFYPNPTNGPLWISAPAAFRVSRAHIADAQGRTVGTVTINADGAMQLPGTLEAGTYFISADGVGGFAPQAVVVRH